VIVIAPLHSVTSPTVGVAYLKSSLESNGIACPVLDLNIRLYQEVRQARIVDNEWLHWLFPFGERTYGGEFLMSQVSFNRATDSILEDSARIATHSLQEFVERLDLPYRLAGDEAVALRSSIARFLDDAASELALAAETWLGFSVVVTSIPATIRLARDVKRLAPHLRIIAGGPHFHRGNARQWLDAVPEFDAVFLGDARLSLQEWLQGTEQSSAGLVVERNHTGVNLLHQPLRGRMPDHCFADWSGFELQNYESSFLAPHEGGSVMPVIPVHGAAGCSYNRCTFCYEVLLTPRFMARTPSDVVGEVQFQCKRHSTNLLFFTDLDFNSDYQRTLDLCRGLRTECPSVRFSCWLRAHELDSEMLESLYAAGGRQMFIGIESVTDNLLSLMAKGYDRAHAISVLRTLRDFSNRHSDVRYAFNLITNYPGENLDDVKETLALVRDEPSLFQGHVAALFQFSLTQNTIAWARRDLMGLKKVSGFLALLLPDELKHVIPSHQYFYDDDGADAETRTLLWDVLRMSLGRVPRYLRM